VILHAAIFTAAIEIKTQSVVPLVPEAKHQVIEMQLGAAPRSTAQMHAAPKKLNNAAKAVSKQTPVDAKQNVKPVANPKLTSTEPVATVNSGPSREEPFVATVASSAERSRPSVESGKSVAHEGAVSLASTLPYIIASPPPAYPREARSKGWTGRVSVRVLISELGTVQNIEITASSGYASLDDAALKALRQWRFHPGYRDGHAVAAWVIVPVLFKLD